jgi:DNA-binding response OmpR family regulator
MDLISPILLVEQDAELGAAVVEQLCADGYTALLARTAEHARVLARASPPALVIIGELESARRSLDLLSEIRVSDRAPTPQTLATWPRRLPAIVLCSHPRESDLLRAFDAGADDFLARPASYLELRARLRALLARAADRAGGAGSPSVDVRGLVIDPRARAVSLHRHPVRLRRLEYELLLALARDPERVFTRHELMRLVWGYEQPGCTRTLDSHASRVRRSLVAFDDERWVVNVRGVGYRLT